MIKSTTFDFLKELKSHNDKQWFEDHRDEYEAMRANLTDVASALLDEAGRFDDSIQDANPDPKKCLTRTHRDMRFGTGKPPYKSEVFIMLNGVGEAQSSASYYLHIEPGNVYAGGGIFVTEPKVLDHIRRRITSSYDSWLGVAESPEMQRMFPKGLTAPDSLKIAPHGYDVDDPAIEYLRMKGFCANRALTRKQVEQDSGLDDVVQTFLTVKPMVDFINTSVQQAARV